MNFDFDALGWEFAIPYVAIHGEGDLVNPLASARRHFERVGSPQTFKDQLMAGSEFTLAAPLSGAIRQYPIEKTDSRGVTRRKTHMALVRLDPETRFGISITSSGPQIAATFEWARISYVRTPVVNDWIERSRRPLRLP